MKRQIAISIEKRRQVAFGQPLHGVIYNLEVFDPQQGPMLFQTDKFDIVQQVITAAAIAAQNGEGE